MEPDYKKMYFKMMAATEAAIDILIKAQRECEEIYISVKEDSADDGTATQYSE